MEPTAAGVIRHGACGGWPPVKFSCALLATRLPAEFWESIIRYPTADGLEMSEAGSIAGSEKEQDDSPGQALESEGRRTSVSSRKRGGDGSGERERERRKRKKRVRRREMSGIEDRYQERKGKTATTDMGRTLEIHT
jgi:Rieske Fe-S protein